MTMYASRSKVHLFEISKLKLNAILYTTESVVNLH